MTVDTKRRGRPEFCRPVRAAGAERLIGRGLKSLFSDVLSEPLPDGFLRVLRTLEKPGSECTCDPRLNGDETPNPQNTGRQLIAAGRNAA
jgi:hypothetical protein